MGLHESIKNLGIKMNGIAPAGDTARDQLNSLGSTLTGTTINGRTIADAINDIADAYVAPLALKITPVIDDSIDLLGKVASDLQENIEIAGNGIIGKLFYVDDYTGFSGDPAEQSGNYIALKAEANKTATITAQVIGGTHGASTLGADGIVVCRIASNSQKIQFVATAGDTTRTYTFDLTDLELEEAPVPPTPPTPSFTPYINNETIADGDKIYFDTTGNTAEIMAGLEYALDPDTGADACYLLKNPTPTQEDPDNFQPILTAQKQGDIYLLEFNPTGTPANPRIIWASEAIPDAEITAGWQNLDGEDYGLFDLADSITIVISAQDGWNGYLCGKKDEPTPPAPSLTPLGVGDTFANGDKIYFDKSAGIDAFLQGLTYSEGQLILAQGNAYLSEGEPLDSAIVFAGNLGTAYILGVSKNGDTPVIIYASEAIPDYCDAGWQNIGDDDAFAFDFSDSMTTSIELTSINSVSGWNGVIVGKQAE